MKPVVPLFLILNLTFKSKTMKNITIIKYFGVFLLLNFLLLNCQRNDDQDDIPQEEITDIILNVKDLSTQLTASYDYNVGAVNNPVIKLEDGKTYEVSIVFRNGNQDATEEIIEAKDEHFLLFDFPKSNINLTRIDSGESIRTDGNKVGLKTQWEVIKTVESPSPVLVLTLIHDAASVSETKVGTTFGSVTGGETDAEATYLLEN